MPDHTNDDQGLNYLLARGRLERIEPRPSAAEHLLAESRRHLASAQLLLDTDDVSMAFISAYDAARKALTAILALTGMRATGGDGGHAVVADAVRLICPNKKKELQRFDWMRNIRNSTEYPDTDKPTATRQDVGEGITTAEQIVCFAEEFSAAQGLNSHARPSD